MLNVSGSERWCWKIHWGLTREIRYKVSVILGQLVVMCIWIINRRCGTDELVHFLSTDLEATQEKTRAVCWRWNYLNRHPAVTAIHHHAVNIYIYCLISPLKQGQKTSINVLYVGVKQWYILKHTPDMALHSLLSVCVSVKDCGWLILVKIRLPHLDPRGV